MEDWLLAWAELMGPTLIQFIVVLHNLSSAGFIGSSKHRQMEAISSADKVCWCKCSSFILVDYWVTQDYTGSFATQKTVLRQILEVDCKVIINLLWMITYVQMFSLLQNGSAYRPRCTQLYHPRTKTVVALDDPGKVQIQDTTIRGSE